MASSYTDLLRIEQQADGENNSTWGQKLAAADNMLEDGIAGRAAVVMASDANRTLTTANGTVDEARMAILYVTSGVALTTTRDIIVPTSSKKYVVTNATTGGQSIRVKTAAGTGITIPNGNTSILFCDGTNVLTMLDYIAGALAIVGPLTISAQPAFRAYAAGTIINNVTGDGTDYTIALDTKSFDRATNFNTGTYTFTAPVTGLYQLSARVYLEGLAAGHTDGVAWIALTGPTSATIFDLNVGAVLGSGGAATFCGSGSVLVAMTAGDTASLHVSVSGSTKTVDIVAGAAATMLCGHLAA